MIEIVAGIDHHRELVWRQHAAQPKRELGAADPAGQRHMCPSIVMSSPKQVFIG